MPFCPKCGKDIQETVNYCPNCGFPVSNLFNKVEGSQQFAPMPPQAPAPYVVKGIRTAPITAAAIICLIIGVSDLMLGFSLFGLLIAFNGQVISPSTPEIIKNIITIGLYSSGGAGLLLLALAVLHLFGWYWLWGAKLKGGVLGLITGIIDLAAVIIGMIWLSISILPTLGMSLLAVPFLLPFLVAVSFLGLITLIMIALGWKTLA